MFEEEKVPYKIRKDQKSKTSHKSDHKHEYVKKIGRGACGWVWYEQCSICGKTNVDNWFGDKEFIKPEYQKEKQGYHMSYFYSEEELRELYPNVEITTKYLF